MFIERSDIGLAVVLCHSLSIDLMGFDCPYCGKIHSHPKKGLYCFLTQLSHCHASIAPWVLDGSYTYILHRTDEDLYQKYWIRFYKEELNRLKPTKHEVWFCCEKEFAFKQKNELALLFSEIQNSNFSIPFNSVENQEYSKDWCLLWDKAKRFLMEEKCQNWVTLWIYSKLKIRKTPNC